MVQRERTCMVSFRALAKPPVTLSSGIMDLTKEVPERYGKIPARIQPADATNMGGQEQVSTHRHAATAR